MIYQATLWTKTIGHTVVLKEDGKLYFRNQPVTKLVLGTDVPLLIEVGDGFVREQTPLTRIEVKVLK